MKGWYISDFSRYIMIEAADGIVQSSALEQHGQEAANGASNTATALNQNSTKFLIIFTACTQCHTDAIWPVLLHVY